MGGNAEKIFYLKKGRAVRAELVEDDGTDYKIKMRGDTTKLAHELVDHVEDASGTPTVKVGETNQVDLANFKPAKPAGSQAADADKTINEAIQAHTDYCKLLDDYQAWLTRGVGEDDPENAMQRRYLQQFCSELIAGPEGAKYIGALQPDFLRGDRNAFEFRLKSYNEKLDDLGSKLYGGLDSKNYYREHESSLIDRAQAAMKAKSKGEQLKIRSELLRRAKEWTNGQGYLLAHTDESDPHFEPEPLFEMKEGIDDLEKFHGLLSAVNEYREVILNVLEKKGEEKGIERLVELLSESSPEGAKKFIQMNRVAVSGIGADGKLLYKTIEVRGLVTEKETWATAFKKGFAENFDVVWKSLGLFVAITNEVCKIREYAKDPTLTKGIDIGGSVCTIVSLTLELYEALPAAGGEGAEGAAEATAQTAGRMAKLLTVKGAAGAFGALAGAIDVAVGFGEGHEALEKDNPALYLTSMLKAGGGALTAIGGVCCIFGPVGAGLMLVGGAMSLGANLLSIVTKRGEMEEWAQHCVRYGKSAPDTEPKEAFSDCVKALTSMLYRAKVGLRQVAKGGIGAQYLGVTIKPSNVTPNWTVRLVAWLSNSKQVTTRDLTTGPSGVELTGKVLDEQKVYVQSIYWEGSLGDGFSDFDTVNVRLVLQPDGPKGDTYFREGSTTMNSVKVKDKDSVEIDLQVYPPDEKDWYLKYKNKDT